MTTFLISVVIGLALIIGVVQLLKVLPTKFNWIISIILIGVIAYLGYLTFNSIYEPVKFEEVKEQRFRQVIQNLTSIRDAEGAHKSIVGTYEADINKLAKFIDTAQFVLVQKRDTTIADSEKNRRYGLSDDGGYYKERTLTDTLGYASVKDSLFRNIDISNLLNIPVEGLTGKIKIETGTVLDEELELPVFRAYIDKKEVLWDQPEQLVNQELKIKAVEAVDGPTIQVGSLNEVSTSGNWPRQYAPKQK